MKNIIIGVVLGAVVGFGVGMPDYVWKSLYRSSNPLAEFDSDLKNACKHYFIATEGVPQSRKAQAMCREIFTYRMGSFAEIANDVAKAVQRDGEK